MKLNFSLDIRIVDYKITPVFKTIKIGRKKQEVFDKILYEVDIKPGKIVKGILAERDIAETIPILESLGVDFYEHVINAIVTQTIINTNELFNVRLDHSDFEDFVKDNQDMFDEFINNLKTEVNKYRSQYETIKEVQRSNLQ